MTITYKLTPHPPDAEPSTTVIRSDGWHIPADPANSMYQEYLEWLAEGNTPQPAD